MSLCHHQYTPHVHINCLYLSHALHPVLLMVQVIPPLLPQMEPPVGEILTVLRKLYDQAHLVEEPQDDTEDDVNGGNLDEQGGEQDCPHLKQKIPYHGRADSFQQNPHFIREENMDCVGEGGEGFLHLVSCLAENLSLLAGHVSMVTSRHMNCLHCLQLEMNSKQILCILLVRNKEAHSLLWLCFVKEFTFIS